MANEANNSGQDPNNNNSQSNAVDLGTSGGAMDGIDANIAKHLDMAIEAQDGPAKVEDKKPDEQQAGTEGQQQDSEGIVKS